MTSSDGPIGTKRNVMAVSPNLHSLTPRSCPGAPVSKGCSRIEVRQDHWSARRDDGATSKAAAHALACNSCLAARSPCRPVAAAPPLRSDCASGYHLGSPCVLISAAARDANLSTRSGAEAGVLPPVRLAGGNSRADPRGALPADKPHDSPAGRSRVRGDAGPHLQRTLR